MALRYRLRQAGVKRSVELRWPDWGFAGREVLHLRRTPPPDSTVGEIPRWISPTVPPSN